MKPPNESKNTPGRVVGPSSSPLLDKNLALLEQAAAVPRTRANLLVVDDDPEVRRQLELFYAQSGYGITVAASAEEAIEIFDPDEVDLLITDLKLPEMDGSQLICWMRERFPDIPIIA